MKMRKIHKNNFGFTLIEMVTVMGIFAVVGTISINMMMSMLRASNKASEMNKIKQNGDYALSVLERTIRNARTISETGCSISSADGSSFKNTLTVTGVDNKVYVLSLSSFGLSYKVDSGPNNSLINTTEVSVSDTSIPPAGFTCIVDSGKSVFVQINFNLHSNTGTGTEIVDIPFVTSILLRNKE